MMSHRDVAMPQGGDAPRLRVIRDRYEDTFEQERARGVRRLELCPESNEDLYERRWQEGRNIFTGEPLTGSDLKDWLLAQREQLRPFRGLRLVA